MAKSNSIPCGIQNTQTKLNYHPFGKTGYGKSFPKGLPKENRYSKKSFLLDSSNPINASPKWPVDRQGLCEGFEDRGQVFDLQRGFRLALEKTKRTKGFCQRIRMLRSAEMFLCLELYCTSKGLLKDLFCELRSNMIFNMQLFWPISTSF